MQRGSPLCRLLIPLPSVLSLSPHSIPQHHARNPPRSPAYCSICHVAASISVCNSWRYDFCCFLQSSDCRSAIVSCSRICINSEGPPLHCRHQVDSLRHGSSLRLLTPPHLPMSALLRFSARRSVQFEWGQPTRLAPGDSCSMTKSFSAADVQAFGKASGDWNPVHYPPMYEKHRAEQAPAAVDAKSGSSAAAPSPPSAAAIAAAASIARFPRPLVHGLLTASLIGSLFATHLPGAIYLQQSLHFRAPVFYDEPLTARIEVIAVEKRNRVRCRTIIEKQAEPSGSNSATAATAAAAPIVVVEGEATVLVESLAQLPKPV